MKNYRTTVSKDLNDEKKGTRLVGEIMLDVLRFSKATEGLGYEDQERRAELFPIVRNAAEDASIPFSPRQWVVMDELWKAMRWPYADPEFHAIGNKIHDMVNAKPGGDDANDQE